MNQYHKPVQKIVMLLASFFLLAATLHSQVYQLNTKPMTTTGRILTADELYLSQGSFIIRTNQDYSYLTVNNNQDVKEGSIINLWSYLWNDARQTWQFIPKDPGYFKIKSPSGFFLTQKRVLAPSLDPEKDEDAQLWRITELPDGFYTIMSKTNKYIVAPNNRNRNGDLVTFASSINNADDQKWQFIKWTGDGRRATSFNPAQHGYHFANTFHGIDGSSAWAGLCGGMVYSSMDYYKAHKQIPTQKYTPANRTPLQSFVYGRQYDAMVTNQGDKWIELRTNPFGWRDAEFYEWGLQGYSGGRWEEIQQVINSGNPAPLGLYEGGTTDFSGRKSGDHQVLAIAYAAGRYKGDKGAHKQDMKIILYNPNYPDIPVTLVPDISRKCFFIVETGDTWRTYFVDKKYSPKTPPDITSLGANEPDGSIRHLYATFRTGGDDLRGGNDNVSITINYKDGTSQSFSNVNGGARWVDNYAETVPLVLNKAISKAMIRDITITTSFGGGIGGDNWNLDWFYLTNGGDLLILKKNMLDSDPKPLYRFTGDAKRLVLRVE